MLHIVKNTTKEQGLLHPIAWEEEKILLVDQRKIPETLEYFDASKLVDMIYAIKHMVVRGAPVIGIAAAAGFAAHMHDFLSGKTQSISDIETEMQKTVALLQETRPTAVNLHWATQDIYDFAVKELKHEGVTTKFSDSLIKHAQNMYQDHCQRNETLSKHGATLLPDKEELSILTHCNAGGLATGGWGTALGIIRALHLQNKKVKIFVDETRPRLQGARLTIYELMQQGIECILITDSMAGYFMSQGKIDAVITGADRIASNGDTANKIGTYTLAVLAKAHSVPFYIAAPMSTIDPSCPEGLAIPIEERQEEEVTTFSGIKYCHEATKAYNPSFDITPNHLITAIITEHGVMKAPYTESINKALRS